MIEGNAKIGSVDFFLYGYVTTKKACNFWGRENLVFAYWSVPQPVKVWRAGKFLAVCIQELLR